MTRSARAILPISVWRDQGVGPANPRDEQDIGSNFPFQEALSVCRRHVHNEMRPVFLRRSPSVYAIARASDGTTREITVQIRRGTTVRTRLLILGIGFLALGLWPPSLDAQEKPGAPTCDIRLDLQYELPRAARVTLAGQMEVAPPVVQLIMSKAGDMHWDEVTKHGKKYPGICRDDEHPYYVLVWASDSTTVGEVTVYSATADLHVLDNGCLVYPSVFGLYWINTSREKAIKKVFEAALRFLVENGEKPAPSPLTCSSCGQKTRTA